MDALHVTYPAQDIESRKLEEALRALEAPLGADGEPASISLPPACEAARTRRFRNELNRLDPYAVVALVAGLVAIGTASALYY